MQTIYKYQLENAFPVEIMMPMGAQLLTVGIQGFPSIHQHGDQVQYDKVITLWARVDSEAPKEARIFKLFGTGHSINELAKYVYVGTFYDGPFVWHLFEATELQPTFWDEKLRREADFALQNKVDDA